MTGHTGGAVLRAIRTAGAARATDRTLLAQYAAGDQGAFATLVERHADMVLGVCRRTLPTAQDAEDACQAVFLVLARRAGGRWDGSVANWLYATARKVAANAVRAAARRARREAVAAAAPTHPLARVSAREVLDALDEELDRLPAIYREPLVLCHLEGLTRDEAAARLGVPLATLKSQLDRGRKKLGEALTRRGVGLGAGLLSVVASSAAGACPPRLIDAVLAAVSGPVEQDLVLERAPALPVAVRDAEGKPVPVVLATGIGSEDWHRPVEVTADTCAACALDGTPRLMVFFEPRRKLFGTLALKGPENAPATVTLGPGGAVVGRLVLADGKPLVGVTVSLRPPARPADEIHAHVHDARPVESDSDGRFRIDDIVPGEKFELRFTRGTQRFEPAANVQLRVESGKTTDAGVMKLEPRVPSGGD